MKCDEARELIGSYLDSELDARSVQEMRQHLAGCPDCARLCQNEERLDAILSRKLREVTATPSFWRAEEEFVAKAFQPRESVWRAANFHARLVAAWRSSWRQLLWPAPRYYAGLAVVWLLMLVLHQSLTGPARTSAVASRPISRQSRLALLEQRRELKELLAVPEPAPAAPRHEGTPPRSERQSPRREAFCQPPADGLAACWVVFDTLRT